MKPAFSDNSNSSVRVAIGSGRGLRSIPCAARAVRRTFFGLFSEGLIYRGRKLVNWDTFLQTAVSDDEVVKDPVQGFFWHFRYPVIDARPGEPTHVEIATTRPETMLGDTAVAVHPDPEAALAKIEAELQQRLATAGDKDRGPIEAELAALAVRRREILPRLLQLRDMSAAGRRVLLPLLDREIPLVCDVWAKPELGTGCVKITPAHDPNDYEVGLRQQLPMINILRPEGTLNANAGPYEGLTIKQARERVVADLEQAGLLGEIEDREIELPHSDRSKTPIEPYLASQWFVRMDRLAQTAMDAVINGDVRITPSRYAKGYLDWLAEKRDWPIGRQLWWGHRIPIWSRPAASSAELETLQASMEADPAVRSGEVVWQIELTEAHQESGEPDDVYAHLHLCPRDENAALQARLEAAGFIQDENVLDTWFSSALWPHSTLGWPDDNPDLDYFYPTSVLITSRDIITLWVARMVLAGIFNTGRPPFRDVYIHPKILDGYGETMSKSKGNGVDPLDVIEKFGADALRFGIAYLTTETQDVRLPVEFECPHCHTLIKQTKKNRELPRIECTKCGKAFSTQWARSEADRSLPRGAAVSERFELGRNFANKLWNASRFSIMNLEGYTPAPLDPASLAIEDRWLLSRLSTVTEQVSESLESFRYADAARRLYDFAWDEFCSFYIEMAKPRLADEAERATAQRMLAWALDTLLRLLHPMIPFLTEEVWQHLARVAPLRGLSDPQPAAPSVMIAPWPTADPALRDPQIEEQFAEFQAVLGGIREVRSRQNIPPKETIEFSIHCPAEVAHRLERMAGYFAAMAKARCLGMGPHITPPERSASVALAGIEVFVDIRRFIDVEAEIARLEKELTGLAGRLGGLEKKLGNADFVNRAPADVVQRERERLGELVAQQSKVSTALEDLRKSAT